jgi:hypothetical protein
MVHYLGTQVSRRIHDRAQPAGGEVRIVVSNAVDNIVTLPPGEYFLSDSKAYPDWSLGWYSLAWRFQALPAIGTTLGVFAALRARLLVLYPRHITMASESRWELLTTGGRQYEPTKIPSGTHTCGLESVNGWTGLHKQRARLCIHLPNSPYSNIPCEVRVSEGVRPPTPGCKCIAEQSRENQRALPGYCIISRNPGSGHLHLRLDSLKSVRGP